MKKRLIYWVEGAGCVLLCAGIILSVVRLFSRTPVTRALALGEIRRFLPWLLLFTAWTVFALTLREKEKHKISAVCSLPLSQEKGKKRSIRIGSGILSAIFLIPVLIYLTDARHFEVTDSQSLDAMLKCLLIHACPWLLGAITLQALCGIYVQRQLCLSPVPIRSIPSGNTKYARIKPWAQGCLFLCSVLLILHGILNGSMWDVLVKAIHICTECIGLG